MKMKIYRGRKLEPEPIDDWRNCWNPDKRRKPNLVDEDDEPEEMPSPEFVLHPARDPRRAVRPTREEAKKALMKRLESMGKSPPSVQEINDDLLNKYIAFDRDKARCDDEEVINHEKSRSITRFYYEIRKYIADIEKTYHDNIWKIEKELPGWMMKDRVIADLIKNTRLADVLKALRKHSEPIPERRRNKKLMAENSVERRLNKGYLPVCFVTDKAFYDKILPELGMAQNTLQKYLIALRRVGAIKKIEKNGLNHIPRRSILYCIGYHYDYPGGQKTNWLLTEKLKKQLREFKLP